MKKVIPIFQASIIAVLAFAVIGIVATAGAAQPNPPQQVILTVVPITGIDLVVFENFEGREVGINLTEVSSIEEVSFLTTDTTKPASPPKKVAIRMKSGYRHLIKGSYAEVHDKLTSN